MKVILISTKGEFDKEHLKKLQTMAEVRWIDNGKTELINVKELFDNEDKILAFSPVPMDWKIPKNIYGKFKNIKNICLSTTAYEFLDMDEIAKNNLKVSIVTKYSGASVAEGAIFMMLGLFKKYRSQLDSDFKEIYSNENLGGEVFGKTAGIIGMGDIGSRLASLCAGMGMKVQYYSKNTQNESFKYMDLTTLLKTSDVIFPAYTINTQTENMLTKELLSFVPKTSYFVDFVGKRAYDSDYLLERVSKNEIAGYAFESLENSYKKLKGNIFVTAQINWYTRQSLSRNIDIWTNNIISCIQGKPEGLVN